MRQVGRRLKTHPVDVASLRADPDRFRAIVDDLRAHAGDYLPRSIWLTLDNQSPDADVSVDTVFADRGFDALFSTMDKMLDAWLGTGQVGRVDAASAEQAGRLCAAFDPLDLWAANVGDPAAAAGLITADLGSITDLSLLYAGRERRGDVTTVLEVGGGYGRLAEAAFNVFGDSVKWVLVDAVPGSLYYAVEYLRRACPAVRVGSHYDGDPFDLDRFDCYVVPSWHFDALPAVAYDACVNIESFQEMEQHHVDAYLAMFDRVIAPSGLVYVANAHDYVFRGAWRYPARWRRTLCANGPRSWTPDHPYELFVATDGDHAAANAMVAAFHDYAVASAPASPATPTAAPSSLAGRLRGAVAALRGSS